jgi:hypothetical protein
MPSPISGPGIGLPLPQNLYPSYLQNAPLDNPSNKLALAPGDAIALPAGDWYIVPGFGYCVIQYLDPVTGTWSYGPSAAWSGSITFVKSDGFNCRIANLTGCPVSASVTAAGTGYVQATTTITANVGGSTWLPIIGGQLTASVSSAGAGYGVPPLIFISPPPPAGNNANGVGGVPASAYAVITSGTVSTVSFTNPGAGYPGAFTVVAQPSPYDPNLSTGITAASIVFGTVASGSLTGALCTNNGTALTAAQMSTFSLTVAGAGSSATLTANIMQTITAYSISGVGIGYGNALTILGTTAGGGPSTGSIANNPDALHLAWRPRPAQVTLATTGAGGTLSAQLGTILDGGLFLSAPSGILVPQGIPTTIGTVSLVMGSSPDVITVQPAP